jgi:hypothetical protein
MGPVRMEARSSAKLVPIRARLPGPNRPSAYCADVEKII